LPKSYKVLNSYLNLKCSVYRDRLFTKLAGGSVDCDFLTIGVATATGLQVGLLAAADAVDRAADNGTGKSSIT